jgi:hypothetical protein
VTEMRPVKSWERSKQVLVGGAATRLPRVARYHRPCVPNSSDWAGYLPPPDLAAELLGLGGPFSPAMPIGQSGVQGVPVISGDSAIPSRYSTSSAGNIEPAERPLATTRVGEAHLVPKPRRTRIMERSAQTQDGK